MLYKCLYSHGEPYISKFFNLKNVKYNSRGLSTRLEYVNRSFTFLFSKLWNALPPMVRESKDIVSFKRALKIHMT